MRTFFKNSSPTSHHSTPSTTMPSPIHHHQHHHHHHHHAFSDSLMEDNLKTAQSIITRYETDSSTTTVTSSTSSSSSSSLLFSGNGREEAKEYIKAVTDLQTGMHVFVTENSSSEKLVRAQSLMQVAMKRLEKEFYRILSSNREYLDPESVTNRSSSRDSDRSSLSADADGDDEVVFESEDDLKNGCGEAVSEADRASNLVMRDLKMIADCMISSGYGKECVKIYKITRKSIIDEGLYNLGVDKFNYSQVHKMDWNTVEVKIKHWLHAVKISVKKLFYGERILCDFVFQSSPSVVESCFTEISTEGAITLFGLPELVAKCNKSPEKMFRTLDLYEAMTDLSPEIESIFSFDSTSNVRSQTATSLVKLGDAVRIMLTEFESAIQKESSKSAVPGGGIHPLTRYVMNYISLLAEYSLNLADIFANSPLTVSSPLPEAYFDGIGTDDSPTGTLSIRLAWLVLVLLCKLDGKAELHKDVVLSYLFLANNLQYVVTKVRSSNLKPLLGDLWLSKHETKIKQYASNYERLGWNKVFSSLPQNPTSQIPTEMVRDHFMRFNMAFEETYRTQSSWVVTDSILRDEIKVSIERKLMPTYRAFYEKYRMMFRGKMNMESIVRFSPDDLDNYLSDLFHGNGLSCGSTTSWSISSSTHSP